MQSLLEVVATQVLDAATPVEEPRFGTSMLRGRLYNLWWLRNQMHDSQRRFFESVEPDRGDSCEPDEPIIVSGSIT